MRKYTAIYLRVSSRHQDAQSQKRELDRWQASMKDSSLPVKVYQDKFTGRVMDRPGWNALYEDMLAGKVARIVVWRLDRLGRTAKGLTALFEELRRLRVNLISIRDGIDLETPAGRMMANVLASVAQYETEVRAERVQAGVERAKAAGKKWGGSKAGRLLFATQEQLDAVLRMAREGVPIARIARTVQLSRPTIYRMIRQHGVDRSPETAAS